MMEPFVLNENVVYSPAIAAVLRMRNATSPDTEAVPTMSRGGYMNRIIPKPTTTEQPFSKFITCIGLDTDAVAANILADPNSVPCFFYETTRKDAQKSLLDREIQGPIYLLVNDPRVLVYLPFHDKTTGGPVPTLEAQAYRSWWFSRLLATHEVADCTLDNQEKRNAPYQELFKVYQVTPGKLTKHQHQPLALHALPPNTKLRPPITNYTCMAAPNGAIVPVRNMGGQFICAARWWNKSAQCIVYSPKDRDQCIQTYENQDLQVDYIKCPGEHANFFCPTARRVFEGPNYLVSPNRKFVAEMTPRGSLVVLNVDTKQKHWEIQSGVEGASLQITQAGEIEFTVDDDTALTLAFMNSDQQPKPWCLVLLDSGKIAVQDPLGKPISWSDLKPDGMPLTFQMVDHEELRQQEEARKGRKGGGSKGGTMMDTLVREQNARLVHEAARSQNRKRGMGDTLVQKRKSEGEDEEDAYSMEPGGIFRCKLK